MTIDSSFIQQLSSEVLLREAWHRVQRGGRTGGVDGMTTEVFRAHADARLDQLRQKLRNGTYAPSPLMRVTLPKPGGDWRLLGIPTVIDRVAQTAAALVLHDRVAATFSDRSFAYRPFLGPRRAAFFLKTLVPSARWVVTADIAKFFDNVDHDILQAQLRSAGVDEHGCALVRSWLRAPVHDRQGKRLRPVKGLPQGSTMAPILANLYLTPFDTAIEAEGFAHVRYADDFVVLASDKAHAERALRYLSTYLTSRLKLHIKPEKTQITSMDEGFTFVGYHFTRNAWTVAPAGIDRFKDSLTELFAQPTTSLPDLCRDHNDIVVGWRNYYGGTTPEMDRQLAELDSWRLEQCRSALVRHGDIDGVGAAWFEHLVTARTTSGTPAGYAHVASHVDETPEPHAAEDDEWHRAARWERRHDGHIFSSEKALRAAEIGRRQVPELSQDGWLRVPTYGAFVSKSRALVAVRRKKQVIFECAFGDVKGISIETDGAVLSTLLIEECARRAIPLTLSRTSGRPFARLAGSKSRLDAATMRLQVRASRGRTGTPIAQAILDAKLANQRALLLYHAKYRGRATSVRELLMGTAETIAACRRELLTAGAIPMRTARRTLFLIEARAAAYYWHAFAGMVDAEFGFPGRQHRDARDVVNKSLNYGYGFLLNRTWLAVHHAGLEPSLGLLHTGRRRTPGLVFDLMEPFRQPVVDRSVLSLIGRGARLSLNRDGDLSLRTRHLLQTAFNRRLQASTGTGKASLDREIRRAAVAFRRAAERKGLMSAYRMSW